eukprot:914796-Ditylum_brightwellii.AAC.1
MSLGMGGGGGYAQGDTTGAPPFTWSSSYLPTTTPQPDMPNLNDTIDGADIIYFPLDQWLCLGFVGIAQTKVCTRSLCDISSHQVKGKSFEGFCTGLYIKASQNTVYASPYLAADKIPLHLLKGWMSEQNNKFGKWRERFALHTAVDNKAGTAGEPISLINNDFSGGLKKLGHQLKIISP